MNKEQFNHITSFLMFVFGAVATMWLVSDIGDLLFLIAGAALGDAINIYMSRTKKR